MPDGLLTREDLFRAVKTGTGKSFYDSARLVDSVLTNIVGALARGESVSLRGLGTFEVYDRAARTARHPRTGEPTEVAGRRAIRFKVAASLKAMLKDG
jgi:DNA-binding protein HU-beta